MRYSILWRAAYIQEILEIKQYHVDTMEFAKAIISNFGNHPKKNAKKVIPNMPGTPVPFKLEKNPMMVSKELVNEKIVGVDLFIESEEQPVVIAKKCERHAGVKF